MHGFPCFHANDEAQRVIFANPLSRGLCLLRFPSAALLRSLRVLPLSSLTVALLLRRAGVAADKDDDALRYRLLADLMAMRF